MRRTVLTAAISAGAFVCAIISAWAGTLIPVPQVPGSTATYLRGINDSNVIVGDYMTADDRLHGFVGTLDGQYTTFDYGDVGDTVPQAIGNDGRVTGWWGRTHITLDSFQFVRDAGGAMRRITLNGQKLKGMGEPGGVLDSGEFVGSYAAARKRAGFYHSPKAYSGIGTEYTSQIVLPFRDAYGPQPTGLNAAGDIVGYFARCSNCGGKDGFLLSNGIAHNVAYPGPNTYSTWLTGINDAGIAVGYYYNRDGTGPYPFVYNPAKKRFTRLPGDTAFAINSSGVIALNTDSGPQVYCMSMTSCPSGGAAVAVQDNWVPAGAKNDEAVVCTRQCRIAIR